MRQATLDILDAELRDKHRHYTSASLVDRQRFYRRDFLFDPTGWSNLYTSISNHKFTWNEFRFCDAVASNDIDTRISSAEPGLYIFYVRPQTLVYRFPQLALYVGISNATGTGRSLRDRLKDYMKIGSIRKRANIHQMLQLYYDYIWVAYSHLSLKAEEMVKLETYIHDFLRPPFGRSAFSPKIKAARGAWDN
jgi:hypothetical protein